MARVEKQLTSNVAEANTTDATSTSAPLYGWRYAVENARIGTALGLKSDAYVQFQVDLPIGSTVVDAVLELMPFSGDSVPSVASVYLIQYYSGDLRTDISSISPLGAAVTWTFGAAWVANTTGPGTRVEIKGLVQRLVDRVGYAPGDMLTLVIIGAGGEGFRSFHGFDSSTGKAARLTTRWYQSPADRVVVKIEDLIADSSSFRAWTGSADRYEALYHIRGAAASERETRPYVLIDPLGEEFGLDEIGTNAYAVNGGVQLRFVGDMGDAAVEDDGVIYAEDKMAAMGSFESWVVSVLWDIRILGKSAGYLNVADIGLVAKPELEGRQDRAQDKTDRIPIDVTAIARIGFGVGVGGGGGE